MASEDLLKLTKDYGVPLVFAVIFMAAIYVMYRDSKEQNQRFIELHRTTSQTMERNTQILDRALENWIKVDQEASRQRERQIQAAKLQQRTIEQWISSQKAREKERKLQVDLFIHAINRLTREQGQVPVFPQRTK